jgi:hypothetical protein
MEVPALNSDFSDSNLVEVAYSISSQPLMGSSLGTHLAFAGMAEVGGIVYSVVLPGVKQFIQALSG